MLLVTMMLCASRYHHAPVVNALISSFLRRCILDSFSFVTLASSSRQYSPKRSRMLHVEGWRRTSGSGDSSGTSSGLLADGLLCEPTLPLVSLAVNPSPLLLDWRRMALLDAIRDGTLLLTDILAARHSSLSIDSAPATSGDSGAILGPAKLPRNKRFALIESCTL